MDGTQIPILHKAVDVIHFIAQSDREPTPREAASALGIAPTSCHRIFQTFLRRNWVQPVADGRFGLSLGLHPLLERVAQNPLLSARTRAALAKLARATGITSKISIREGNESVTILREESTAPMALGVRPGARFHLGYGSSGAVLLAGCDDEEIDAVLASAPRVCWELQKPENVRERIAAVRAGKCAVDLGQYRPDIFGISAPIRNADSRICGALTLTGLAYGVSRRSLDRHGKILLAAAARISAIAGKKERA